MQDFQRQGIGTLLLNKIEEFYTSHSIIAETDDESIDFYAKSCFSCHEFKDLYGNIRYKCELIQRALRAI